MVTLFPTPEPQYPPALSLLMAWYEQMDGRLRAYLTTAVREGWDWRRCQALLTQIELEIEVLLYEARGWDYQLVETWHDQGGRMTAARLAAAGIRYADQPWLLPAEALRALAEEISGQRALFLRAILRETEDFLRRHAAGEIAVGLGVGSDFRAVGRAIRSGAIDRLRTGQPLQELAGMIDRAVGVVYRDDTVHSLHAYGQMAGNTGMAHAQRVGQQTRLQANRIHLVRIPRNGTLCYRCFYFEGRVFALDAEGEALGYPSIAVWRQHGEHPNCRHIAYIPVTRPGPEDRPPDAEVLGLSDRRLYRKFRDEHDALYRASRQGFASRAEWRLWRRANPDLSPADLRGPRYRYAGIEQRRLAATAAMLRDPELAYADAMDRETQQFMAGAGYARQRPPLTPAAQARAVARYQEAQP